MDSFAKAKLKSENCNLRTQIDELNHKLDIVNNSLNKYIQINQKQDQSDKFAQLILFIKLKNNIIKAAKIDEEDRIEIFINQFIMNNQNDEILKKIFPIGCKNTDRYRFYRDLKELYARVVHNSTN